MCERGRESNALLLLLRRGRRPPWPFIQSQQRIQVRSPKKIPCTGNANAAPLHVAGNGSTSAASIRVKDFEHPYGRIGKEPRDMRRAEHGLPWPFAFAGGLPLIMP